MSIIFLLVCLLSPVLVLSQSNDDLASDYPFNVTLVTDNYWLFWNFNKTTQTISFAVRVKTTGWIGFGLSPNGQMTRSDIVIGWIDNSRRYFHDRYAEGLYTPTIDPVQNWFPTDAQENNGYTTLKFYRNFTTCDNKDLDILPEFMQVVYSWNNMKPTVTFVSNEERFSFSRHTNRGSAVVNLIARFHRPPQSTNEQTLFMGNNNAHIPNSVSYWCKAIRLPMTIRQSPRYITKFAPRFTNGNELYISDMFVYLCDGLENEDLSETGSACDANSNTRISRCFNQRVIAVWGKGGQGGEAFVYPSHVAHKFGGSDSSQFLTIRIRFNISTSVNTIQDSSGIQFTYTSTPRQYNGGILNIGHYISRNMIIPPKSLQYNITGICNGTCLANNLPTTGINVFANLFHAGSHAKLLEIAHFRRTTCSRSFFSEELKFLDRNLFYSKMQQETTLFLREIKVNPGDNLVLTCSYNTAQENGVILGGLSSQEEVCQSFLFYYPYTEMFTCTSYPRFSGIENFINSQVPSSIQSAFRSLNLDPRSSSSVSSSNEITTAMNRIEWSLQQRNAFQSLAYGQGTQQWSICNQMGSGVTLPSTPTCCTYEPNNTCTNSQGTSCCQRQCVLQALRSGTAGNNAFLNLYFFYFSMLCLSLLVF